MEKYDVHSKFPVIAYIDWKNNTQKSFLFFTFLTLTLAVTYCQSLAFPLITGSTTHGTIIEEIDGFDFEIKNLIGKQTWNCKFLKLDGENNSFEIDIMGISQHINIEDVSGVLEADLIIAKVGIVKESGVNSRQFVFIQASIGIIKLDLQLDYQPGMGTLTTSAAKKFVPPTSYRFIVTNKINDHRKIFKGTTSGISNSKMSYNNMPISKINAYAEYKLHVEGAYNWPDHKTISFSYTSSGDIHASGGFLWTGLNRKGWDSRIIKLEIPSQSKSTLKPIKVIDFSKNYETGLVYAKGHWFTTDNFTDTLARHEGSTSYNVGRIERTWSWRSYFRLDDSPHRMATDGKHIYTYKSGVIYKIFNITHGKPVIKKWASYTYHPNKQDCHGLTWALDSLYLLDKHKNRLISFDSNGMIKNSYIIPYSWPKKEKESINGLAYDGKFFWIARNAYYSKIRGIIKLSFSPIGQNQSGNLIRNKAGYHGRLRSSTYHTVTNGYVFAIDEEGNVLGFSKTDPTTGPDSGRWQIVNLPIGKKITFIAFDPQYKTSLAVEQVTSKGGYHKFNRLEINLNSPGFSPDENLGNSLLGVFGVWGEIVKEWNRVTLEKASIKIADELLSTIN